jgi:hypothetical protein
MKRKHLNVFYAPTKKLAARLLGNCLTAARPPAQQAADRGSAAAAAAGVLVHLSCLKHAPSVQLVKEEEFSALFVPIVEKKEKSYWIEKIGLCHA